MKYIYSFSFSTGCFRITVKSNTLKFPSPALRDLTMNLTSQLFQSKQNQFQQYVTFGLWFLSASYGLLQWRRKGKGDLHLHLPMQVCLSTFAKQTQTAIQGHIHLVEDTLNGSRFDIVCLCNGSDSFLHIESKECLLTAEPMCDQRTSAANDFCCRDRFGVRIKLREDLGGLR